MVDCIAFENHIQLKKLRFVSVLTGSSDKRAEGLYVYFYRLPWDLPWHSTYWYHPRINLRTVWELRDQKVILWHRFLTVPNTFQVEHSCVKRFNNIYIKKKMKSGRHPRYKHIFINISTFILTIIGWKKYFLQLKFNYIFKPVFLNM